jgi:CRP-like cAMP-binding protein
MRILLCDPKLFNTFQQHCTSVYCHKARVLFREGDTPTGLYILNRGEATLWTNISGRGFVGFIQKTPKALLGLPGIIDAKPHVQSAIAHNGAELSFVTLKDFTSLVQSDSSLFFKVLRLLAVEVEVARRGVLQPLCVCTERASLLPGRKTCSTVPINLIGARSSAAVRRSAGV